MTALRLLMTLAALYGAAGVSLLAAGSHTSPGNAAVAGQMLLFHAAALIAALCAWKAKALHHTVGLAGIVLLALGVGVFSLDLSLRAFGSGRLFAFAAPAGGSMTIAGWLVLAAAAAFAPSDE